MFILLNLQWASVVRKAKLNVYDLNLISWSLMPMLK